MRVSVCIVPYRNNKRFLHILSQVKKAAGIGFEIIIIDNNPRNDLKKLVGDVKYFHNANRGKLACACNKAVQMATGKFFVYVCSNHARVYSNDWLSYMVREMEKYKLPNGKLKFTMGGDLRPFGSTNHIQGGVFIVQTVWLRKNPYDEVKAPFMFMDVHISKKVIQTKGKILRLSGVYSGMKGWSRKNHIDNLGRKKFKIVHSHETYNYG